MIHPRTMMAGFVVGAGLAAALIQPVPADASPLTCEHRSAAHIAEHGGRLEDDRYHLAHGEMPNCAEGESAKPAPAPTEDKDKNTQDKPDEKSRHCRKVWYC